MTTAGDEKAARTADEAAEKAEAADFKSDVKGTLLADLAMLRELRTALVDRSNAVLDALETKGGDVTEQRLYVSVVSGLVIEVSDTKAAIATIVGWLKSTEGGLRWAANFGRFAGIVFAAWLLSLLIGALVERAMNRAMRTSRCRPWRSRSGRCWRSSPVPASSSPLRCRSR